MTTLGKKQERFSRNIVKLLDYAFSKGFEARLGEFQRTPEQQKIYFDTGKSKTMQSKHLEKLAADIFFTKNGNLIQDKAGLQELGDYWESLDTSNQWGGNWKFLDTPHFQGG